MAKTPDDSDQLRYYAYRALQLVQTLNAFDGSGIPVSDAQDAFAFLRRFVRGVLGEHREHCDMAHDVSRLCIDYEKEYPELRSE